MSFARPYCLRPLGSVACSALYCAVCGAVGGSSRDNDCIPNARHFREIRRLILLLKGIRNTMMQRLCNIRRTVLVIPFLLCLIIIQIEASWTILSHAPALSRHPITTLRGGGSETLTGQDEQESRADEDSGTNAEPTEDVEQNQETTDESIESKIKEDNVEVIHNDTLVASELTSPESMPAVLETTTTTMVHTPENSSTHYDTPTATDAVDTETDSPSFSKEDLATAMDRATQLRADGKSLHDRKKFKKAAARFSDAAQCLLPFLELAEEDEDDNRITDEYATCRLHESLCQLKCENYNEAKTACTAVLDLVESDSTGATPALRARAFYRRAKAEMELGDTAAALQDARSAAFLGDSKAVALYGKLMRESSSGSSEMLDLSGSKSNALFESLLSKSSNDIPVSPMSDMKDLFSSSLLTNMLGSTSGTNNAGGVGSLAKSVLLSLSKRLDKGETQEQICNVLQNTSGPQLRQMASMAGFQLDEPQASKLAAVCKGVTPKLLRKLLKTTKILIYTGRVVQKAFVLLSKYRTVIMILLIVAWAKSAILRPLPVSKRARKLAQQAFAAVL